MKKRNSVKEQTKLSFQLGGTTPMPGTGIINTSANAPTTGFTPYVAPVIPGFTAPQLQNTQYTTATQTTNLPTFGQTVGTKPGEYDEFRRYVNDAGQVRQIPFKNGQPLYPIPEGYRFEAEDTTQVTTPTTTPTTTTGQQDDGGGGDGGGGTGVSGSVQGPAGGPTGVAGLTSAFSGLGDYFSGAPAKAETYGGTTLGSLNAMGMVSRDAKGNVIGPSVTDFSNNIAGVKDAFGVYGAEPINVSAALSVVTGNIPGALAAVRSRDSGVGMFGQAAPTGYGAFSTQDLMDYAQGTLNPADAELIGIAMNQNQAFARAQVQRAIGTPITGLIGYKPGSISPITGTPVNSKGRVVNFQGSTTGVDAGFASMGDWMDALSAATESGYWGGPKSAKEVGVMTKSQAAKYNGWAAVSGHSIGGEGPETGPGAEAAAKGSAPGVSSPSGQGRSDYSGGYPGGSPSSGDGATGMGNTGNDTSGEDPTGGSPSGGNDGSDNDGDAGEDDGDEAYCLTEDMKVKLNGTINFVTNIKVGDMIDNYKVKEVLHKHMRSGYYAINNELKISNDHPVLANGTWTRSEDLVVGDSINGIPVASLEYVEHMTPTVSIVIDGESFDVHTENNIYTVHGRYREVRQEAA